MDLLRRSGDAVRVLHGTDPEPGEVLVLQKAYLPVHRELAARHRAAGGAVVLDVCDDHFSGSSTNQVIAERASHLLQLLDHVDVVSVCTDQLAEVVPHDAVMTVNDALDPAPVGPWPSFVSRAARKGRPRVLWFGTAGAHGLPFGMRDLARVLPDLDRAAAALPYDLVVMSNSKAAYQSLPKVQSLRMMYLGWRRPLFEIVAAASQVAILPVEVNQLTRGKTSNRIATSLTRGLAVVTDPLPSYLPYAGSIRMGSYGDNVVAYLAEPDLRAHDVASSRVQIEREYGPNVVASQWRGVIRSARERRESS